MCRTFLTRMVAVAALALAAVSPVAAQANPYSPNLPNPYTATQAARVIRATGNLDIQQAQAQLVQEQANQAALQTQRMAFDEGRYEAANTPSYLDQLSPWVQGDIHRVMTNANPAEIQRGDTLNLLMPYIKGLADQGTDGPSIPVSADTVAALNVKVGADGPAVGMLKDAGRLTWPLYLRGPTQQTLDGLIPQALNQAAASTLTPQTYTRLTGLLNSMQDDLRTKFFRDGIGSSAYQSSKAFLDNLQSSLTLLQRPDAAHLLDGTYAAHGNNVLDLVENMTASGLQFAPATPGSEAAYQSLHNAFVSYLHAVEA